MAKPEVETGLALHGPLLERFAQVGGWVQSRLSSAQLSSVRPSVSPSVGRPVNQAAGRACAFVLSFLTLFGLFYNNNLHK